ncbi:MAG: leucine-rich repeat domain-containing protein, partial [Oscillospiraceae bacterium]|nr:leucine-rich repeat domain-containing protein [Oscillospiraceae bacterium]
MNYKTRICAFLLTLALLCGLLPGMNLRVHAETVYSGSCGDNLSWRFDPDSGTLTIEGSGAMTDYVDMGPWEDHAASIRRLVFPSGITSIGGCAFANCTALTELNLPEGISSSAWGAFSGCTDLTSVMLPASLTDLSSDAFMRCTKLTAFQIAEENPVYSVDAGGVLLNKSQTRLISFPCGRTGSYAVPDSVRSIGYGAFEGCSGLTEIRFPEGLRSIEEDAFHDCTGLTAL